MHLPLYQDVSWLKYSTAHQWNWNKHSSIFLSMHIITWNFHAIDTWLVLYTHTSQFCQGWKKLGAVCCKVKDSSLCSPFLFLSMFEGILECSILSNITTISRAVGILSTNLLSDKCSNLHSSWYSAAVESWWYYI